MHSWTVYSNIYIQCCLFHIYRFFLWKAMKWMLWKLSTLIWSEIWCANSYSHEFTRKGAIPQSCITPAQSSPVHSLWAVPFSTTQNMQTLPDSWRRTDRGRGGKGPTRGRLAYIRGLGKRVRHSLCDIKQMIRKSVSPSSKGVMTQFDQYPVAAIIHIYIQYTAYII